LKNNQISKIDDKKNPSNIEGRCEICNTPLMLVNGVGWCWTVDEQPYRADNYEETQFGYNFIDEHVDETHLIGKFCCNCNKIYDVEHTS